MVVILVFLSFQNDARAEVRITRASVTSNASPPPSGAEGNNDSQYPSVSPDGRFVAFISSASNLVGSADTNGIRDVFVKDRQTGTIVRANTTSTGLEINCTLSDASITVSGWGSDSNTGSFDGYLRVVFAGICPSLVNDTQNAHIYVKTLDPSSFTSAGALTLVDENGENTAQLANGESRHPKISGNGKYVTFSTDATNLVFQSGTPQYPDMNNQPDVYLRDLTVSTGASKIIGISYITVTVGMNTEIHYQNGVTPCINRTGSRIAFVTTAGLAGSSDTTGLSDFYMWENGSFTLVSASTTGSAGNKLSKGTYATINHACNFSSDGRYVVFPSEATDLVSTGPTNLKANVFLRDMSLGQTYWVNKMNSGTELLNDAFMPTVSDNGRFISFYTVGACYLYDRQIDTQRLLPNEVTNVGGNSYPEISKNGRYTVFATRDGGLVLGDANDKIDVFTYDISNKAQPPKGDFNLDGATDLAFFRPSNGTWYSMAVSNFQFGQNGDIPATGDFDGDGKSDFGVFRPSNGYWYLQQSQNGFAAIQFGQSGDIPVAADYDGDEKTDIAVWRASGSYGYWYIQGSLGSPLGGQFGINTDKPVPGDYDKDGKADIAVFRPSNGYWYLSQSYAGFASVQFGNSDDIPVQTDYDGDGATDLAVYRTVNGDWYWKRVASSTYASSGFGLGTDKPTPGDFDNDGKADFAVFRPSTGGWYIEQSSDGTWWTPTLTETPTSTDIPIPNSNVP